MLVTAASPLLALNSPRILVRSPASAAAFALLGVEHLHAALQLAIEQVGFAAELEQLLLQRDDLAACRSFSLRSMTIGWPIR